MISIYNEELPKTQKEFRYYCMHNCIYKILAYFDKYSYKLLMNLIMSFNCIKDDKYEYGYHLDFGLGNPELISPEFGYNIVIKKYNNTNMQCVFHDIEELIDNDVPVVIANDAFLLPYSQFYKKAHFVHSFIYCGSEDENILVLDEDWISPYKGKLNKEIITESIKIKHLSSIYEENFPEAMLVYVSSVFNKGLNIDDLIQLHFNKNFDACTKRINELAKYMILINDIIQSKMKPKKDLAQKIYEDVSDFLNAMYINNFQFKIICNLSKNSYLNKCYDIMNILFDMEHSWEIIRNICIKAMFMDQIDLMQINKKINIILQLENQLLINLNYFIL